MTEYQLIIQLKTGTTIPVRVYTDSEEFFSDFELLFSILKEAKDEEFIRINDIIVPKNNISFIQGVENRITI